MAETKKVEGRSIKGSHDKTESRVVIIETAERLFTQHGFANVSLRAIALASGFRNVVAVQYHFGNKDGLIRAIFEHRMPWLEVRRAQLMESFSDKSDQDETTKLVSAFLLPLYELVDVENRHSYASFLFLLQQFDNEGKYRINTPSLGPLTSHLVKEISRKMNHKDEQVVMARMYALFTGFLRVLIYIDKEFNVESMTNEKADIIVKDYINIVVKSM